VGGAGFIVMSLAIFNQLPGQGAMLLYGSESSGEKLTANVIGTAKAIWKVYLTITLIMVGYLAVGTYLILPEYPLSENLFDAINHAMTGQSTGGFSTLDDSIAGYQSEQMDALHILPMILGSLSIPFLFRIMFQGRLREFWDDLQARAIFIAFVLGSAAMSVLLAQSNVVAHPIREGIFQFVSALSTTGWQTSNVAAWDDISLLFIITTAMIVGGCAGATVGGIKVIRAVLLLKGLRWQVNKVFFSKNTIKSVFFNHKRMLPSEMNKQLARVGVFTLLYLIFVFISSLFTVKFMGPGFTLADAIFESASAQGTVGLSNGITDPSMSPVLEFIYIIQMWTGRLEILPVLVLIRVIMMGAKPRLI
jgi:trk system potassium uptake protein TrkH